MFKVSQSKVKTWRQCHRAYHLKYVENLRRVRKSRPLQFGTLVHEMIDSHANGKDWMGQLEAINLENYQLFQAEREMYGDIVNDVRIIMQEYFAFWGEKSLTYIKYHGRYSEHEFELPISDSILFKGKVDAIVKTPNKLRWIGEHKTFTRMPNEDERWRNLQSAVYLKALQELEWPEVEGLCWDYIRSKPPASPQLLKSGKMSERALDTLPTKLLEVLAEHELKAKDFSLMIEAAKHNRTTYFVRTFSPVKEDVVEQVFTDFVETSQEMMDLHGKSKAKNIGRHCSWCDFEAICRGEMTRSDIDFIKEREYYVSETEKPLVKNTAESGAAQPTKKARASRKKGG